MHCTFYFTNYYGEFDQVKSFSVVFVPKIKIIKISLLNCVVSRDRLTTKQL